MNLIVKEWVDKAEGDWHTAKRELRVRNNPNYDAACFHAQQCAEKYLKAYLQSIKKKFSKTHNLLKIMELCSEENSSFELQLDILTQLNKYAVLIRYPGEEADKMEAKMAVDSVAIFRKFVRDLLELR